MGRALLLAILVSELAWAGGGPPPFAPSIIKEIKISMGRGEVVRVRATLVIEKRTIFTETYSVTDLYARVKVEAPSKLDSPTVLNLPESANALAVGETPGYWKATCDNTSNAVCLYRERHLGTVAPDFDARSLIELQPQEIYNEMENAVRDFISTPVTIAHNFR